MAEENTKFQNLIGLSVLEAMAALKKDRTVSSVRSGSPNSLFAADYDPARVTLLVESDKVVCVLRG